MGEESRQADPRFRVAAHKRLLTATERNGFRTFLILSASILLFTAFRAVERGLGRWAPGLRVVPDPAETTMRYLGQAHFLMAYLFTATSRRMRAARPWVSYGLFFLIGLTFCGGLHYARAWSAFLGTILVYGYFVVHDFRDQTFFYFANGDAPAGSDRPAVRKAIVYVPWLAIGSLAALLAAAAVLGMPAGVELREFVASLPSALRPAVAVVPALAVGAGAVAFWRLLRAEGLGSPGEFLRAHRPVFLVYATTIGTLLVGGALGWRIHTLVIFHVVSWYVFSVHLMRSRPPTLPVAKWRWPWFRSTPAGFTLLHAGIVVALLGAGVAWAYVYRNNPGSGPLWLLLDSGNFQYWTVLHVTVSLVPK